MKASYFFSLLAIGLLGVYGCNAAQGSGNIVQETSNEAEHEIQTDENNVVLGTTETTDKNNEIEQEVEVKVMILAQNYYRYDKAHFEQSLAEGKTIFLDLHADWCPICNAEQPHIFAAFNELQDDTIVGYEVHYNDGKTNAEDREAIKKYNIRLQHTKVIINGNGDVVSKSLEQFDKAKVLSEISKAQ